MRVLYMLACLASFAAVFATSPVRAETDFPVIGGSGTGSFEDRCPAGEYLIAIEGRAGSWVDQVQIGCRHIWKGRSWFATKFGDFYRGAMRGGQGGANAAASCGGTPVFGVIRGIWPHMTPGNRQVKYIDLYCINMFGRNDGADRFNRKTNPALDVNGGSDQPQQQICPDGEVAVGLRGRYGADVNAVSVICDSFDLKPFPQQPGSQPPEKSQPENTGMPIRLTGHPG